MEGFVEGRKYKLIINCKKQDYKEKSLTHQLKEIEEKKLELQTGAI